MGPLELAISLLFSGDLTFIEVIFLPIILIIYNFFSVVKRMRDVLIIVKERNPNLLPALDRIKQRLINNFTIAVGEEYRDYISKKFLKKQETFENLNLTNPPAFLHSLVGLMSGVFPTREDIEHAIESGEIKFKEEIYITADRYRNAIAFIDKIKKGMAEISEKRHIIFARWAISLLITIGMGILTSNLYRSPEDVFMMIVTTLLLTIFVLYWIKEGSAIDHAIKHISRLVIYGTTEEGVYNYVNKHAGEES
jgi:hypothetical protein